MKWTARDEARVRALWEAGWTGEQIARDLGLSRDQVLSKLRRMALGRALRFADEVATYGCVEKAARAVGVSVERGRVMFSSMCRELGWQAS